MPLIDSIVTDLMAQPRPVLCLDTCDFLNLIECVAESEPCNLQWGQLIYAAASESPPKILPCISFLVETEFLQNADRKVQQMEKSIRDLDKRIKDLFDGAGLVGAALGSQPIYSQNGLHTSLRKFAEKVMGCCTRLDRDEDCVLRAVNRVIAKTRPSHRGELKDSIHIEHYLELGRRCRTAGFAEPLVFVSSNSRDFWETSDKSDIHPDLKPEFDAAKIRFFGKWEAACGFLGL